MGQEIVVPAYGRRIFTGFLGALTLLLIQQQPLSACEGRIQGSTDISGEYDPFHPLENRNDYQVDVENTGNIDCVFSLFIRDVPQKLGSVLAITIDGLNGGIRTANDASMPDGQDQLLSSHRLRPGETRHYTYSLSVPAGQLIAAGVYEDRPELVLYASAERIASGENGPIADQKFLQIRYRVTDQMSINIAGAGRYKTIDFGELTQGAQQEIRIWARSNQKFLLSAGSANGGAMALQEPYNLSRVRYTMSVNGKTMTLPADIGPFEKTGHKQENFDFLFTIGEITNQRAGLYSDEITIEINAAP